MARHIEELKAKPPVGVLPRESWFRNARATRLNELQRAISEYAAAGLLVSPDWVMEYNELVEEFRAEERARDPDFLT